MAATIRAFTAFLPGALLAVLLLLVGDLMRMAPHFQRYLTQPQHYIFLFVLLSGLYLLSAFAVSLLLSLLLTWGLGHRQPVLYFRKIRSLGLDLVIGNDAEPRRGCRFLSLLATLLLSCAVNAMTIVYLSNNYKTVHLIAVAATASLLLLVPLWVLFYRLLYRFLFWLCQWEAVEYVVHSRTTVLLAAATSIVCLGLAVVFERQVFKEYDGFQLFFSLAALLVFALGTLWLSHLKLPTLWARALGSALLLLVIAGLLVSAYSERTRILAIRNGRTFPLVVAVWNQLLDFDRDGYAPITGGGDCSPFNSAVSPGGVEIPDNGVDDDCFNGDLGGALQQPERLALTHPSIGLQRPNIILLSIDGCRRDMFQVYGAQESILPNLDRLAQESIVFEDAISAAPWTMPSLVSLMTGRYSAEVPGFYRRVKNRKVPKNLQLLAEPFAQSGYVTYAITAGIALDQLGLTRGFGQWFNVDGDWKNNSAGQVFAAAADMIRQHPGDKPFFLWLHLIDAHQPYRPPEEHKIFPKGPMSKYKGELHSIDHALPVLQAALTEQNALDKTVLAVTADHGEAFREHGFSAHGSSVYVEEISIPLFFRVPGLQAQKINAIAGLIDLGPTLWDMAQLDVDTVHRGRSLLPTIVGGQQWPDRWIFTALTAKVREFSLANSTHKLLYNQSNNYLELFDRRLDPMETKNIAPENPELSRHLKEKLLNRLAPILHQTSRNLKKVVLKSCPASYRDLDGEFKDGTRLVCWSHQLNKKQLKVSVVFRAKQPLPGRIFKVILQAKNSQGQVVARTKSEVTDGVFVPGRWRENDHVLHTTLLRLKTETGHGVEQLCLSLAIDRKELPFRGINQTEYCWPFVSAED